MFQKERLKQISNNSGVYLFKSKQGKTIYVGKALNLRDRIRSYFSKQTTSKSELLVNEVVDYSTIEVSCEVEAIILEANLIKKYRPAFNISLRDDKSFLYIAVSDEEFPRVLSIRKNDRTVAVKYLYGPFPSSQTVRSVLKMIRRVFPYCTQSPRSKKPCFYSHIGLCNPCPGFIRKQKEDEYKKLKKKYQDNIQNIKKFLEGNLTKLTATLTKQMKMYSKNQYYEEAKIIYSQIRQIEYITKPYYKISNFINDPNFLEKERKKGNIELYQLLKQYLENLTPLKRIEGIDISNVSGRQASGGLVVFIEGEKNTSLYRRFKIQTKGVNDVAMIAEVLQRRLQHTDWDYPNLFVIDGGKPQVGTAIKTLDGKNINIPVIGLAKRFETIIIRKNESFLTVSLKKDSSALRLIQEIRDEAHRFAQKYHHRLRRIDLVG